MTRKHQEMATKPFANDGFDMNYNCCAICGVRLPSSRPYSWFCYHCYEDWKDAIHKDEPWVVYLVKLERARRYKMRKMREMGITVVYLGLEWDVDNDGRLVRRSGGDNGQKA